MSVDRATKVSERRQKVQRARRRLRENIQEGRSYALVLVSILVSYFVTGIIHGNGNEHIVIVLLQGFVLLFALRVSNISGRPFRAGVVLWVFMVVVAIAALLGDQGERDIGIARFASAALFGYAIVVIGLNLARRKKVDSETTLGVISIYLLLGMFFAFLTMGMAAWYPGDFFVGVSNPDESEFLFYSFITLTTVGYGNLVPHTSLGQTLASFEAICGTLFLILAIGRTISVIDSDKRAAEEREIRHELRSESKREWAKLHARLDAAGMPAVEPHPHDEEHDLHDDPPHPEGDPS